MIAPQFCCLSLGANLGNAVKTIYQAIDMLQKTLNITNIKASSLYITPPLGPPQPKYINAVVTGFINIPAKQLLDEIHSIEKYFGRNRSQEVRWGPRPLDIDIVIYNNHNQKNTLLEIPHPGLLEREFILIPLQEIEPNLILPNGLSINKHIKTIFRNTSLPKISS